MTRELTTVLELLRRLQKIDQEFPMQYAVCLCEIALDEGLSLTTLSTRTGMPLSTVSRIIGALSSNRQKGKPYELVHVGISPTERRKKELYLTIRGRTLLKGLASTLSGYQDQRLRA